MNMYLEWDGRSLPSDEKELLNLSRQGHSKSSRTADAHVI